MLWIILTVIIVVIDQVTKYFVVQNVEIGEKIPIIGELFYLTLHMNPGAAWGVLQNGRIFFLIIVPLISIFVVYYMIKNKSNFLRFTLALILAGAVGNYIDRLFIGEVRDFLLFYIGSYPFPVFNVADMAVTCGTIAMAIYVLFIYKEPEKKEQISQEEQVEQEEQIEQIEQIKQEEQKVQKEQKEQMESNGESEDLTTKEQETIEDEE